MLAIRAMRNANIEAVSVMQDVATGALVVFAASRPAKLDVSTQVLPRALSKVFLAASGWDRKQPDLLDIRVASLLQCTISLAWAEEVAPCPFHDHIHPTGAMEGARCYIAGAAYPPGRPLSWRTVFRFSRAERSPLRRHSGVRRRTGLDHQHLVPSNWVTCTTSLAILSALPRRLFLVPASPARRHGPHAPRLTLTQPGIRLRAVPGQPHLVRGARFRSRTGFMCSPDNGISTCWPPPAFSSSSPYRFDNRLVLSLALSSLAGWFGLTISALAVTPVCAAGSRVPAICHSLQLDHRRRWGHAPAPRPSKRIFFGAYLNIAANVLFWALLSPGSSIGRGYSRVACRSPRRLWRMSRLGPRPRGSFPSSPTPPFTDMWALVRSSSAI